MPTERQPAAGAALPSAVPFFQFPAESTSDRWLIEEHDHRNPKFGPKNTFAASSLPDYGITHSTRDGYRLVRIVPSQDKPGWYVWTWANERNRDDATNYAKAYLDESASHPSFTRQYVVLREDYAEPVFRQPLRSVIGLSRSADGTSALDDGIYDLTFSGGAGTGATGKFQIVNGSVEAQWITNCGTGYTSAPTVVVPGVTGAAITALVQPQTAVLVHCDAKPADEGLGSIFLNVTKVYETLDGPVMEGQTFDKRTGIVTPFTEQKTLAGVAIGDAYTEITPIDDNRQTVRVITPPTDELLALSYVVPGQKRIDLPRVLRSVTITYNKSGQTGENIADAGLAYSSGTSGSLTFSPSASAQASASIIPDAQIDIAEPGSLAVPVTHYFFYIANTSTRAQILTKLASLAGVAVTDWPIFQPVAHTITLNGEHVSIQQSASSRHADSWSQDNLSYSIEPYGGRSDGFSKEAGVSVRTVRIPPTIHGILSWSANASDEQEVTVTVKANIPIITGSGIAPSFAAVTNEPAPLTATAHASVTPTGFAATAGTSSIPTTGLYMEDLTAQPDDYDLFFVHATVVDMSIFA